MTDVSGSRTVSIFIRTDVDTIVRFVSNPMNLPCWAKAFCKSVRLSGTEWQVETPQGPVTIRFVPPNPYGLLDHYVGLPSGEEIYVPMRALPVHEGCEVLFTLLRLPEISDRQFDEDTEMVRRDLHTLKMAMERSSGLS